MSLDGLQAGRAIEIVKLLVVFAAPLESVTVTVTDEFPVADGVPEITPVELLMERPF